MSSNYVRNAKVAQVGEIVDTKAKLDTNDDTKLTRLNTPSEELLGDVVRTQASYPAFYSAHNQKQFNLKQTIYSPDAGVNQFFGYSVKISGDGTRFVCGQTGYNTGNGRIHVYLRTGDTWAFEQSIDNPNIQNNASFGYVLAIDYTGTRIGVVAKDADVGANTSAGRVYVYSRSGTTWSYEAELAMSDFGQTPVNDEEFGLGGISFDRDAEKVVVGNPKHGVVTGTDKRGAIYTWTRSGAVWTAENYIPNFGAVGDNEEFGWGVNMSRDGKNMVAQARYRTVDGVANMGVVLAWYYSDISIDIADFPGWIYLQQIKNPFYKSPAFNERWGNSPTLSANGGFMIAGGPLIDNPRFANVGSMTLFRHVRKMMNHEPRNNLINNKAESSEGWTQFDLCGDAELRYIAAGAFKSLGRGIIYMGERHGEELRMGQVIDPPIVQDYNFFGQFTSMSDDGEWMITCSIGGQNTFSQEGIVFPYKREKVAGQITLPTIKTPNKFVRSG
jgi:hypothetical protein